VDYGDLAIRDGLSAANTYEALLREPDRADADQVLADLRAYCARDTLAMVALHRALLQLR
jgi:hypothetical protein